MTVRPMLAAQKYRDPGDLWSPAHELVVQQHLKEDGYLIVQPKWDGFRMVHHDGVPMSRSGKSLVNEMLQKFVKEHPEWDGIDGEQMPGHDYHHELFRIGMSETRSAKGSGDMMIIVYDHVNYAQDTYTYRRNILRQHGLDEERPLYVKGDGYNVKLVLCPQITVKTLEELYAEETRLIGLNFEGAIVRRHGLAYKNGRATALGGQLTKVKRRQSHDAIVTGYYERMQNGNEAKQSELGYSVRSSHQENMIPTGMLGGIHIKFVNGPFKDTEQKTGVFRGLTHGDLEDLWRNRDDEINPLKGRYCEVSVDPAGGGYDAARCPVWLKWRPKEEF